MRGGPVETPVLFLFVCCCGEGRSASMRFDKAHRSLAGCTEMFALSDRAANRVEGGDPLAAGGRQLVGQRVGQRNKIAHFQR